MQDYAAALNLLQAGADTAIGKPYADGYQDESGEKDDRQNDKQNDADVRIRYSASGAQGQNEKPGDYRCRYETGTKKSKPVAREDGKYGAIWFAVHFQLGLSFQLRKKTLPCARFSAADLKLLLRILGFSIGVKYPFGMDFHVFKDS